MTKWKRDWTVPAAASAALATTNRKTHSESMKRRWNLILCLSALLLMSACAHLLFPGSGRSPTKTSIPAKPAKSDPTAPAKFLDMSSDSYRIRIEYPSKVFGNAGFSIRILDRSSGKKRRVSYLQPEVKWDYSKNSEELNIPKRGSVFDVRMSRSKSCQEGPFHLFLKGKIDPTTGVALRESISFSLAQLCVP